MKDKKETFVRINSRLTPAQHKFAKAEAKKLKISEGEMHRVVFDFYIKNHNK
jgi:hypothetical protein